ncbi:MAG: T9SS type A sorting domain-containing protein [Lacinutrix venerupis]
MKKTTLSILAILLCAITFAQIAETEPNNSRDASGTFTFSATTPQTGTGVLTGNDPDFWNFPAQIYNVLEFTLNINGNSPNTVAYFKTYQLDGSLISSIESPLSQGANMFSESVQSDRLYSLSFVRNNLNGSVAYSLELTTATVDPSLSTNTFELEPSDFIYYNTLKQITTSNKISNVAIYNLLGQNILNSNNSKISLNTFKTGVYVARIQSIKGAISTRKFIVN